MSKSVSLVPISVFLVCFLTAKDFWFERPYTDWTEKQALKILTKSPWSSTQIVGVRGSSFITGPSPAEPQSSCSTCPEEAATLPETLSDPQALGSSNPHGGVTQLKFYVRFRTATPVRMALARLAVLKGSTSEEKAEQYLDNPEFPGQIVVVVEPASEGGTLELDHASLGQLQEGTYLLLKKSKRRIGLQQYVTPSQFGGNQAFFIFPKKENEENLVGLDEKEIWFSCQLNREIKI